MPNNKEEKSVTSSAMASEAKEKGAGTGNRDDMVHADDSDDLATAGGRKGNFSEKERDDESQWSPGSTQSSDR